jgi:uncharacterized protein with predicted RNA binding PUA domain
VENALSRIRSIADYQFGKGIGTKLFPDNVGVTYSKTTGRIRYVHLNGERLVTLRPTDGLFSLSITAARILAENRCFMHCFVTVQQDVSTVISEGHDVFAAHVIKVDRAIHAKDEVVVVDEEGAVLAVGRALLSSAEMRAFKSGVAVKVRRGCAKES